MREQRLTRNMSWLIVTVIASVLSIAVRAANGDGGDFSKVPGVVIDHSPASSGLYIGSPSILILGNGDYLASHDVFGPKSNEHVSATTKIFRSADRGKTWSHLADIHGAFWSTLFEQREMSISSGLIIIMGVCSFAAPAMVEERGPSQRTRTRGFYWMGNITARRCR